jgi:hypothetical protein
MPGATPVYGLPYPISTDRLDDAVTTIPEDLALAVESTIAGFGGIAAPGAWQVPSFGASWSDFGSQEFVRYRKVGNQVIGVGLAKRTSGAVTTIYTLPVGFRPTRQTIRPTVIHGTTVGMLDISTAGVITAPAAYVNGNHLPVYFEFWLDQP